MKLGAVKFKMRSVNIIMCLSLTTVTSKCRCALGRVELTRQGRKGEKNEGNEVYAKECLSWWAWNLCYARKKLRTLRKVRDSYKR